jgi:hypothetical protein
MAGVPGQRGHVPKRSIQRRRRNAVAIDRVGVAEQVVVPDLDLEDVHPLARDFYESLRTSGQSRWYEPSDWQRARIFTALLSKQLFKGSSSSMMYAALQKDMDALLVSEAERRRVRMEVERLASDTSVVDAKVSQMARYRQAAGKD